MQLLSIINVQNAFDRNIYHEIYKRSSSDESYNEWYIIEVKWKNSDKELQSSYFYL